MTKLISELISKEAFTAFGYKIVIRNETSHTQVTMPELISIKGLKENGIILEMPINSCQKGHSISLYFFHSTSGISKIKLAKTGNYRDAEMEAIAKVGQLEVNEASSNTVFVDINFTQVDLYQWKKIIELYAVNQNKIDDMLVKQYGNREK